MPHIITTGYFALRDTDDPADVTLWVEETNRAVATLDEIAVKKACRQPQLWELFSSERMEQVRSVVASGSGTIGPLPDGTVIEVAPCDRFYLLRALGRDEHSSVTTDEIIDAYNAAQEAAA